MGPKTKFSKDQIIDAAFEIAKTEGIDSITIREVAKKMGSSIAPIYVNFKTVNELIQAVMSKIFSANQQMLEQINTGSPFHDIGAASLRFAKEYPILFKDLAMKSNDYMKAYNQDMEPVLIEQMKKDPVLEDFTDEELRTILLKMRVFQLGLSVMLSNGLLSDNFTEDEAIAMLDSTASDVITAASQRKSRL